ncbi:MAG: hypothetical protein ACOY9Y_07340 [Bacillota bacterium]
MENDPTTSLADCTRAKVEIDATFDLSLVNYCKRVVYPKVNLKDYLD